MCLVRKANKAKPKKNEIKLEFAWRLRIDFRDCWNLLLATKYLFNDWNWLVNLCNILSNELKSNNSNNWKIVKLGVFVTL
jgi:hypothetical protein